jgi:hypothetical protein
MNRKKKMNETLKKKVKKMNAKRNPKNKEKYVSKADREKLALTQETDDMSDVSSVNSTDEA